MALEINLKTYLLCGKQLSEDEDCLCRKTLQELRVLAKDVNIRLAGSSCKADMVDQIIGMAWIGVICGESLDEETDFCGISYITSEVRDVLHGLPEFSRVKEWSKKLKDVLKDFIFMNLLIFLVYGRDKSSTCNH